MSNTTRASGDFQSLTRVVQSEQVPKNWPTATATASDANGARNLTSSRPEGRLGSGGRMLLDEVILDGGPARTVTDAGKELAMFPTPAARDYRAPNAASLEERTGSKAGEQLPNFVAHELGQQGALNPEWVEMLCGFPRGWLDVPLPPKRTRKKATTSPATDGPRDLESPSTTTNRPASRSRRKAADRS